MPIPRAFEIGVGAISCCFEGDVQGGEEEEAGHVAVGAIGGFPPEEVIVEEPPYCGLDVPPEVQNWLLLILALIGRASVSSLERRPVVVAAQVPKRERASAMLSMLPLERGRPCPS
mmetsp:Transcript_41370/g.89461  ORF Transcript_41370/g.89461 Transcript_41370/m.89461 type:complete len:116 (-) Transcript_41370:1550-1897(-)